MVVERYRERLSSIDVIKISPIQSGVDSNFAYFPIVIYENKFGSSRNEVKAELSKNGIGVRKYFYPLTNTFDCFHGQFDEGATPVALKISLRGVALPLYADLSIKDVDRICDIIISCKK